MGGAFYQFNLLESVCVNAVTASNTPHYSHLVRMWTPSPPTPPPRPALLTVLWCLLGYSLIASFFFFSPYLPPS